MTILCRTLGHQPSRKTTQMDPFSFKKLGECKRCGIPLVRDQGQGWKPAPVPVPSKSAA